MDRLEDQLAFYDARSRRAQLAFKGLKGIQMTAAAVIPVATVLKAQTWVAAGLGALILVVEGLQQLNQYQSVWITYRSTAESLKHEKFLFLARAGPYGVAADPSPLLAERIEGLVSQEHAKWVSLEEATRNVPERKD